MPTFIKADDDVVRLIAHVIEKYHKRLTAKALGVVDGVRISAVMAIAKVDDNGDPVGPALKHHGYPCLAKIRIVPHKDRVQGMADAEIVFDGDRWTFLSQDERIAIIDHELTHLEPDLDEDPMRDEHDKIVKDASGALVLRCKRDDGGRPKLKARLHDHQVGWFVEVAQRHGKHSQEVQQARVLVDEGGQIYMPWLDAPPAERGTVDGAVAKFVDTLKRTQGVNSVTIEHDGKSVTIPAGGAR